MASFDQPAGDRPFFDYSLTISKMESSKGPAAKSYLRSFLEADCRTDLRQKKLVDDGRPIHQFLLKREAVPQPLPFLSGGRRMERRDQKPSADSQN
jgi:hypothetical protein